MDAMAAVLKAWRCEVLEHKSKYLEQECQRVRNKLGKQAESIWNMRKEDLVRQAQTELGFDRDRASEIRAGELRIRLR